MNYSFEYIDIILLAMIVGFIFLRLRGILGRRNDNEQNFINKYGENIVKEENGTNFQKDSNKFDDEAKEQFIKGAKIAYETIIVSFANGNLKDLKPLLDKKIFIEFSEAINERKSKKLKSETTFIGIKSAKIKNFSEINSIYHVTVDFISELITCTKNPENEVIDGNPDKIKIVSDTWKFIKDKKNKNPNWFLAETQS